MNGRNGTELVTLQEKFANPPDREPFEPSMLPTADDVWATGRFDMARALHIPNYNKMESDQLEATLLQHLKKKEMSREQLEASIAAALQEIETLEIAARNLDKWNIPPGVASSVDTIVRFSSPGLYNRPEKPPEQPDRYTGRPWAPNMDRWADDLAARLGIVIAGIRTGVDLSVFAKEELLVENDPGLNRLRENSRQAITRSGVKFLYSGRPDEIKAVRRVIHTPSSFVPPQSVEFEDRELDNTLDQVRLFGSWLENQKFTPETRVVLVGFAPHLMRTTRMFEQHHTIPDTITLSLFPIATPQIKTSEYPLWETKGAVCYYGITGDAALKPCKYEIIGG